MPYSSYGGVKAWTSDQVTIGRPCICLERQIPHVLQLTLYSGQPLITELTLARKSVMLYHS